MLVGQVAVAQDEIPLWNQPNIQLTPKPLISHTPFIFFIELSTEHFLEGSAVIVSADLIFGHEILRLYTSSIPPPLGSLPTSEKGAGVGGGGKVGGVAKVAPQVTPQVAPQVTPPK